MPFSWPFYSHYALPRQLVLSAHNFTLTKSPVQMNAAATNALVIQEKTATKLAAKKVSSIGVCLGVGW